jgi:hypothetical protein
MARAEAIIRVLCDSHPSTCTLGTVAGIKGGRGRLGRLASLPWSFGDYGANFGPCSRACFSKASEGTSMAGMARHKCPLRQADPPGRLTARDNSERKTEIALVSPIAQAIAAENLCLVMINGIIGPF